MNLIPTSSCQLSLWTTPKRKYAVNSFTLHLGRFFPRAMALCIGISVRARSPQTTLSKSCYHSIRHFCCWKETVDINTVHLWQKNSVQKSDNLQYSTLDCWVDRLIDQASDFARVAITWSVTFAAEKRQLTSTRFICDRRIVFKNPTIFNIVRWIAGSIVSSTKRLILQELLSLDPSLLLLKRDSWHQHGSSVTEE